MKKNKAGMIVGIIIGSILIFLQLVSVIGNAKNHVNFVLEFDNIEVFLYDLLYLIAYFFVGIIGAILIFLSIYFYYKKPKANIRREKTIVKQQDETASIGGSKSKIKKNLNIFTNLWSLILSTAAIIFIVISMNTQDYERNLHEPCNPTFVYAILLSILILISGFSIVSLIKNRFKLVAGLSTVCAVATTAAMIEGSILSGYYFNSYYHRIIYNNADILENYNTIWISFVFLIFLVTVIPVIINTIKTFTQFRYHSIAYRESCYKRVSKMKDYLDQGIITEEEFTKNKQEILKNIKL